MYLGVHVMRDFWNDESGATQSEWVLMIALIAICVITVLIERNRDVVPGD